MGTAGEDKSPQMPGCEMTISQRHMQSWNFLKDENVLEHDWMPMKIIQAEGL